MKKESKDIDKTYLPFRRIVKLTERHAIGVWHDNSFEVVYYEVLTYNAFDSPNGDESIHYTVIATFRHLPDFQKYFSGINF